MSRTQTPASFFGLRKGRSTVACLLVLTGCSGSDDPAPKSRPGRARRLPLPAETRIPAGGTWGWRWPSRHGSTRPLPVPVPVPRTTTLIPAGEHPFGDARGPGEGRPEHVVRLDAFPIDTYWVTLAR